MSKGLSRLDAEAILSELSRRNALDPLLSCKLFRAQEEFKHSVLYEKQENYYLGANRCGKSLVGANVGATLARFGYPDDSPMAPRYVGSPASNVSVRDRATSGWVSALDFPTSRDTIQPKYFDNGFCPPGAAPPFIPRHEILEWRQNDQVLRLKCGSIIGFKSADSGRSKYQGAEKDWVHLDEEHPENVYDEISIRVGKRPLNIFVTATLLPPEGTVGGITWTFPRVVEPWKQGELPHVGVFRASIYDNPHIPKAEIERLEARFPPGSTQGRIRLNGELLPGLSGARVYASFDRGLNMVRNHPEMSRRRPIIWTWDFNVEPMVSLVCQHDEPYFRVYHELVLDEGNIGEMCEAFRKLIPAHYAEIRVHGDASGHQRSAQSRQSSYTMIQNFMMDYPAPVRMHVPWDNPSVDGRIQAVNRCCRDEAGRRLLLVHESCKELIGDLEQVVSDGRGGIKKVTNRKDSYFRRTHTCLVRGTGVRMLNGEDVPIETIRPGDMLSTGLVTAAGPTHTPNVLVELELSNGRVLRCSKEHRFLAGRGVVCADALGYSDALLTAESAECQLASLMGLDGLLGQRTAVGLVTSETFRKLLIDIFTDTSGSGKTARSLTDTLCTILTEMLQTMSCETSSSWNEVNTRRSIVYRVIGLLLDARPWFSRLLELRQRNGIKALREGNGIDDKLWELGLEERVALLLARNAGRLSLAPFPPEPDSAIKIVNRSLVKNDWGCLYDLTVENHHCYEAEGVLVSNSDALGYWLSWAAPVTLAGRQSAQGSNVTAFPRPRYGG